MMGLLAFCIILSIAAKARSDVGNPSRDADSSRSLSDIIWSCLTTIFLCTWSSLHPNIPKPVDETKLTKRQYFFHKLHAFLQDQALPFVLLLLAPEWVLMWALRQRLMVEYMVRKGDVDLTRRHAFFIIMGGFYKFTQLAPSDPAPLDPAPLDPLIGTDVEKKPMDKKYAKAYGEPDHPLDRFDVFRLVEDGILELPLEVEIDDRSKSDWIAKSLVLIQTLWFVIQCIARKIDHLPLAELEVVTLGYALLNLLIYVIWWDKPQKVTRPIRVFCGDLPERCQEQTTLKRQMEEATWYGKLLAPIFGTQDDYVDLRSLKETPIFYSGNPLEQWPFKSIPIATITMMATAVIGGVVGAIHFLAWSSPFPTHKMLVFWRWASILMTVAPLPTLTVGITTLYSTLLVGVDNTFVKTCLKWIFLLFAMLSFVPAMLFVPLAYVVGRVITLVLAFQTLSFLPPDAFQSVLWTNFIPHI